MYRKSFVLSMLLLGMLVGPARAQLITGIAHRNTAAGAPEAPQIATNPLREDALSYVDRTHQYNEVPAFLVGAQYVMLANDNKGQGTYQLDVTLSKNATIYVFVDNRMGGGAGTKGVNPIITGMPWLTTLGFVDTGEDIGIDESGDGGINNYSSVFAAEVKAGTITLGGDTAGHGGNMYGVAALPRAGGNQAYDPVPEDKATDVPRDITLGWQPGETAATHNVYLGIDFADVNNASLKNPLNVLVGDGQTRTTFEPVGNLAYGKTYYWRVDEVNAPPSSTVFKGEVWSFTVEPYAYPIKNVTATASSAQPGAGPEKTVDGSGLNSADQHSTELNHMWLSGGAAPNWIQFAFDKAYKLSAMWVWNSNQIIETMIGFGLKSVKVEYSVDGSTWTELPGVPELAQATGLPTYVSNTTVNFGGVFAKYVKLTVLSAWGTVPQVGLSEVRFFTVPVQARAPEPAAAATGVAVDTDLNWRPGREAASHNVYFSTDQQAVSDGTVAGQTVTGHSFSPASLQLGTTYYWRVDEVNEAAATKAWVGEIWSFTTEAYRTVEDFESYTDDEGSRIYETWADGYGTTNNGSQVGYAQAPFAERTIIHGGKQAMPLNYANTGAITVSEAVRTFDTPQDWTTNGVKSLSLYFQGAAGNGGQLYLKINNTKVSYNGGAGDIAKLAWIPWNIDLSTVGGNLGNVTKLTIGVEGAGAKGVVYIDDIRLYPKTPEFITPADPGKTNLVALYAFEGNTNDTSGHGLNGTIKQATLVPSGRAGGGSALKVEKAGYVDLGNPPSLDFAGDWTVTAWFKTAMAGTGDANQGTILGKGGDNTGGKRYALIMNQNTEGILTLVVDDDVTRYDANSKTKTNDDQWHFVAGQREGTALRIYIDGQLEGTNTVPATYDLAGTSQHNAYIGASTNHTNATLYKLFSGLIDDVRVYNRALSQAEILWLAGATTPVAKPF